MLVIGEMSPERYWWYEGSFHAQSLKDSYMSLSERKKVVIRGQLMAGACACSFFQRYVVITDDDRYLPD